MTRFSWTDQARSELRQIDRAQALRILEALTQYAKTGQGDVKRLQGSSDLRLRVGDYRVRFDVQRGDILRRATERQLRCDIRVTNAKAACIVARTGVISGHGRHSEVLLPRARPILAVLIPIVLVFP